MKEMVMSLTDDELENIVGGVKPQYTDSSAPHWRRKGVAQGQTFEYEGGTWYCIQSGEKLTDIARRFGIAEREGIAAADLEDRAMQGAQILQSRNPATIKSIRVLSAGDCIRLY